MIQNAPHRKKPIGFERTSSSKPIAPFLDRIDEAVLRQLDQEVQA